MQVDVAAVEEQVAEKKMRESMEQQRDEAFGECTVESGELCVCVCARVHVLALVHTHSVDYCTIVGQVCYLQFCTLVCE